MFLSKAFKAHGSFCASHPWEVIVACITLTCCMMSFSMFAGNPRICGWNYKCENNDMKSSDILILMITRCIAVTYIYLQFKNLRKLGSKYLIGIAGIFTVFSSFVFSTAVIHLFGSDLTGLNEALPFFMLLVDLSKACALARFALRGKTEDEVRQGIAQGMATLGPNMTLDMLVETLVISIGTFSGIKQLDTMCCFGVLSVITNYFAFMTFYPACLALVLDLSGGGLSAGRGALWKITHILQEEPEPEKANPVVQRVKVIMSAGLVMVHIHSRWLMEQPVAMFSHHSVTSDLDELTMEINPPEVPLWRFYLSRLIDLNVDYTITIGLAVILAAKYVLYDTDEQEEEESSSKEEDKSTGSLQKEVTKEVVSAEAADLPGAPSAALSVAVSAASAAPVVSISNSCNKDEVDFKNKDRGEMADDFTVTLSPPPTAAPILKRKSASYTCLEIPHQRRLPKFSIGEEDDESESEAGDSHCVTTDDKGTQTIKEGDEAGAGKNSADLRTLEECVAIMKSDVGAASLTDAEVLLLVEAKHIPAYKLETVLDDHERGVALRRILLSATIHTPRSNKSNESTKTSDTSGENGDVGTVVSELDDRLSGLPYKHFDYSLVTGACCENVVGYVPIPVGLAGPLLLDGREYQVPMATTEGCLVASTNRGCRALALSGGVQSSLLGDGMTRAPVVRLPNAQRASLVKAWIENPENFALIKENFDSTSRFARLLRCQVTQSGRLLFIRFVSSTGDAMGMNMVSKGSEKALTKVTEVFDDLEIMSLSGNYCTDKKPAAINWVEGRGKSVVCEAVIPSEVVKKVLKTEVHALLDLNTSKNLIGSAMAGSIGGFNAHAANMVSAVFIACGQDPAQVVSSANCMTQMEAAGHPSAPSLRISCTMPSVEVGTVGGGTLLGPQSACLEALGVRGACAEEPGRHAATLARIVCATVLAGELSLMSALAAGHLVKSHMKYNRSSATMVSSKPLGCVAEEKD